MKDPLIVGYILNGILISDGNKSYITYMSYPFMERKSYCPIVIFKFIIDD